MGLGSISLLRVDLSVIPLRGPRPPSSLVIGRRGRGSLGEVMDHAQAVIGAIGSEDSRLAGGRRRMTEPSRGARVRQQSERYMDFVWTPDDPRYRKVYSLLAGHRPATLLDIGCGNGAFGEVLVRGGWKCSALELLPDLAQEALRRGLAVARGDTSDPFPFADGKFDVAFAGEILEHQVGDDDFIAECHRVLRAGGRLILTTPNLVSLGNRIRMAFGMLPRFAYDEPHYRIYTLDLLLRKMRAAGFVPLRVAASHILISRSSPRRLLAWTLGYLGEWLASVYPRFGEMFVIVCRK